MEGFKLDKGVAILPYGTSSGRASNKYHFDRYELEDSCFYPLTFAERDQISTSACSYGRGHKRKFVTRGTTEGGVEGTRVWRIS